MKEKKEIKNVKKEIKNEKKLLTTMNGNTLMQTEFEPLSFAVDEILPQWYIYLSG